MNNPVHSELYREYLITVEHTEALPPENDPFNLQTPEYYTPLIDGRDIVYAGQCQTTALAIIAAKQWVDKALIHPLSGKTVSKAERAAWAIEPTTIEDLG